MPNDKLQYILEFVPLSITLAIGFLVLAFLKFLLFTKYPGVKSQSRFARQLVMLLLTGVLIFAAILSLPIGDSSRAQILSLIGIFLTGAIALSSTTFLGNMMAGLMLRAVGSIEAGDFIRVGDNFGRVSESGLLHTEIQNEDRDLTTIPNLYLVTNPVKVVRSSGTIVSAELSLGYDVAQEKITEHLIIAAERAGLEEPFVHVLNLGDFSVTYRISGFLREIKTLISARSRLKSEAIKVLHQAGIEIVSPNFMNQRVFENTQKFIPTRYFAKSAANAADIPEKIIFDKADQAESEEEAKERIVKLRDSIDELKARLKETAEDPMKSRLEYQIGLLEREKARVEASLQEEPKD